jgi:hypothetical protein
LVEYDEKIRINLEPVADFVSLVDPPLGSLGLPEPPGEVAAAGMAREVRLVFYDLEWTNNDIIQLGAAAGAQVFRWLVRS